MAGRLRCATRYAYGVPRNRLHLIIWDDGQHRVPINHSGRQVQQSDFKKFTHILAADESNLRKLEQVKPHDATVEIRLWGSYFDNKPIPDPYYGGIVSTSIGGQCFFLDIDTDIPPCRMASRRSTTNA